MARGDQTKAERRQAGAGGQTKAELKQARAGGQTKAERKQARAGRKRGRRATVEAVPDAYEGDASLEERIESRLVSIEEAVAAQSERSEELLEKLDAMLSEASGSAMANPPPSEGD
jgi:hypothetical protein